MMEQQRVVVVGAGMGGLACAIDLARAGFAVTVVEPAAAPGGKMREIDLGGVRVDAGPTVLTMPWVFEGLFEAAGSSIDRHLNLTRLDVLARHAWNETDRLDLFCDLDRSAEAIGAFAGTAQAKGYRTFSAQARSIYETLKDVFLSDQQTGPIGLANRIGVGRAGALMDLKPFETLWQALGAHFKDPRLRQLFGRYATYCGSSPFAAPATLMLIAHVEQEGVWLVEGGMQRLAEALARTAASLGVAFRHGARVEDISIRGGRVCGVTLADGETLEADGVVVNAGAAALADGTFGPAVRFAVDRVPEATRSLSAVTWALNARASRFPLTRHNVFFSDDYAAEFNDIFAFGRLPRQPTIYVCAQDRDNVAKDIDGPERLLVLVNAPPNGDQGGLSEKDLAACETQVFARLKHCGLELDRSAAPSVMTTPAQFHAMFPATGGALYGQATHGWAAAFRRPGAKTKIPCLYLAGGGAHPGAGVPMAALSGRLAAQRLIADQASTRRWRRGAMFGGISTPSATTAGTGSP
jgi:1-hydroxycarotenoid 3,4-desaturase